MKYRKYPLNHSRVEHYRVTQNGRYNNFIICPDYLGENELKFVYDDAEGNTIEKIIPVSYIGPHLKQKLFFYKDEFLLKKQFRGVAYEVKADIIFNY